MKYINNLQSINLRKDVVNEFKIIIVNFDYIIKS